MATITNSSAINFVLYTKNDFKTNGESTYSSTGDIVFVEKESAIYLNGTYYGITDEQKKAITDVTTKVGNIETKIGDYQSLTTALIDIVSKLRSSVDGGGINAGDPAGTPTLWNKTGILSSATNIVEAIEALASKINDLTIAGLNYIEKGTATNTDIQSGTITINSAQDIVDTIAKVIGSGEAWQTGEQKTLSKLRELIKTNTDAINTLTGNEGGMGLSDILGEIQKIKEELESGEGTGLTTLIDGLKAILPANFSSTGAEFTVDSQKYTTLSSVFDALINKISEAKDLATAASSAASDAATSVQTTITTEIEKLDATVRGSLESNDTVSSGKHVGVKVVETDGKLTEVLVVENDIASAQSVTDLSSTVNTMQTQITNVQNALKWSVVS